MFGLFPAADGNPTFVVMHRFENFIPIEFGRLFDGDKQAIIWNRLDNRELRTVRLPSKFVESG